MDNIGKFLLAVILFPLAYCTIMMMLWPELGSDVINQLGFGFVIGLLHLILLKKKA